MPNPFMGSGSVLEILLPQPEDAKRLALKALEREFALARDEVFEDGMDSNFARALGSILGNHGKPALAALEQILSRNDVNSEVGAEALIQLGFPRPNLAVNDQVELLCRFLQSRNIRFRDAASLGLASLDDPAAIPELRRAIENEKSDLLKASLQEVLDEMSTG